jgi:hypothetical protein
MASRYYDQINEYNPNSVINWQALWQHQNQLCKEMNEVLNKKFGDFPERWNVTRHKHQKP